MLDEKPLDAITVTALCKAADISRITFYSHYDDKIELVNEIFSDMIEIGTQRFKQMQEANNQENDPVISYCNLLDSILSVHYDHHGFFKHADPSRNPYLLYAYSQYIMRVVESHAVREQESIAYRYPLKRVVGFLCYGLCGFINEGGTEKSSILQIKQGAQTLLRDILEAGVLFTDLA